MTLNVEVAAPRRDAAMTRFTVRVDGMSFDVGVSDSDADQLAPGVEPKELVRESFRFLLEREPPESILSDGEYWRCADLLFQRLGLYEFATFEGC